VTIVVSGCVPPPPGAPCNDKPELTPEWTWPAHMHTKKNFVQLAGHVQVDNKGGVDSGPFLIEMYLSFDPCLDEGDMLLRTRTVKKLKPGKRVKMKARRKKVDPDVPVNGFVIAVIDRLDQATECDESNNIVGSGPLVEGDPDHTGGK